MSGAYVAAIAAGSLAALLRYGVSLALSHPRVRLPWAVLVVNVTGSLLAGVALGLADAVLPPSVQLVLVSGAAGGLTTFSTFSVETVQLALEGRWRTAVSSVVANLALGVSALLLGAAAASAASGA